MCISPLRKRSVDSLFLYLEIIKMSKSKKRMLKQKRHERNLAKKNRQQQETQKHQNVSPMIQVGGQNVDPDFRAAVLQVAQSLDFSDPTLFSQIERDFFNLLKQVGYARALFLATYSLSQENKAMMQVQIPLLVGRILFNKLRETGELQKYLPYCDLQALPFENGFYILLDSLKKAKTNNGTAYHSKFAPKIVFDNQEYTVAFSRHAIERICERTVMDWTTYEGFGDAYTYYARCIYFEPCQIRCNGKVQPAFTFYSNCGDPPYFTSRFKEIFLGNNYDPIKKYFWRIGYCPVGLENGFARAITTLYPGMIGTPEYNLLMATQLSVEEKSQILDSLKDISFCKLATTQDFSGLKWMHDNYVPQVVELPVNKIYRYD
jgi:hypothetical protein